MLEYAGIIGPLGTNFSEILIEILTFSFNKMRLKMSSAKWRPFSRPQCDNAIHLSWIIMTLFHMELIQPRPNNWDSEPCIGRGPCCLCSNLLVLKSELSWTKCQYHGCWWPGPLRLQVISSHGMDYVGWKGRDYQINFSLYSGASFVNRGPLNQHGLTLIPAWRTNHVPGKVWDDIIYRFPNLNGSTALKFGNG